MFGPQEIQKNPKLVPGLALAPPLALALAPALAPALALALALALGGPGGALGGPGGPGGGPGPHRPWAMALGLFMTWKTMEKLIFEGFWCSKR